MTFKPKIKVGTCTAYSTFAETIKGNLRFLIIKNFNLPTQAWQIKNHLAAKS